MSASKSPRADADQSIHPGTPEEEKRTKTNFAPDVVEALETARLLIGLGVPVFRARRACNPDGTWNPKGGQGRCGYLLPKKWELTEPDVSVLDGYRPGDGLAAVMGSSVDALDVDMQSGGEVTQAELESQGLWPTVIGRQRTPSGGTHDIINRLRIGSRIGIAKGIDLRGGRDGDPARAGRGFIWIAPTVKLSKMTGEPKPYRWEMAVDPVDLDLTDASGEALASVIQAPRERQDPPNAEVATEKYESMTDERRALVDSYVSAAVAGVQWELSTSESMDLGVADDRDRGWEKIQADAALRLGSLARADWNAYTLRDAQADFEAAAPTDAGWTADNVREKFQAQSRRGEPAPMPVLKADADAASASEPASVFDRAVQRCLQEMKVREAAQRLMKTQRAGAQVRPPVESLLDFLAIPDEPARYRVDDLWPMGGRCILAAQYKAGKSTLVGNAVRSLVDGAAFLGTYAAERARDVVLIDNELDPRTLRSWLRDQDIVNVDRVRVVTLRGRTATFDLMDPQTRSEWADVIRGADVVILDCLRPVMDALGLDENKDAGRFLVAFDALLADSGASEALIVHHMGHNGERSRGDSRLQDWPDVTWKLVREDPDLPGSQTYFSAFGRDVSIGESRLDFDSSTRHLTLVGGTRKDAKVDGKVSEIVAYVTQNPGMSKTVIRSAVDGDTAAIGKAVDRAHQMGLIEQRARAAKGGGHAYFPKSSQPV